MTDKLFVLNHQNSIANNLLAEIRHQGTQGDRLRFRKNLERLGMIMAYEVSKQLAFQSRVVETPLGQASLEVVPGQPVLIGILRAGLPYFQGFLDLFDKSDCGFVGAYRDEKSNEIKINLDYLATPDLENRTVFIIDPMLATGKSFVQSDLAIRRNGNPAFVHYVSLIATPEGINYLDSHAKSKGPYSIWTFAIDEKLNALSYIVPGIGDVGDLCFGTKL